MALSDKDKQYLLSIKKEDICKTLIIELFGDRCEVVNGKFQKKQSRFQPYDEFYLEKGEYFNTERVRTTAGQLIFNKFIIEGEFEKVYGYINKPLTQKQIKGVEQKLADAIADDIITTDSGADFLNRMQWLAMGMHAIFAPSFTMNSLKPNQKVLKRKRELFKEHKEQLEKGDIITTVKIENELLDIAQKELKGDSGMLLYDSGARGSFGNNFKNISVMKGGNYSINKGKFEIVETCFMEGIKKEEIPIHASAVVSGQYPKSVGVGKAGYFTKQLIASMQSVVLDEPNSDCGTKLTLKVSLTEHNKSDYYDRYIVENGKLVLLNKKNMDKYVGKTVNMRSPMFCISDKLCNKCCGDSFNKLNIENVGLTSTRASNSIVNLGMKKFHDSTSKITTINLNTMIM